MTPIGTFVSSPGFFPVSMCNLQNYLGGCPKVALRPELAGQHAHSVQAEVVAFFPAGA
jgi:hypothetical protein